MPTSFFEISGRIHATSWSGKTGEAPVRDNQFMDGKALRARDLYQYPAPVHHGGGSGLRDKVVMAVQRLGSHSTINAGWYYTLENE